MINKIIEEIKEIKTLLEEIKNNQDKIIKFQEVKNSTTIGSTTQKNDKGFSDLIGGITLQKYQKSN